MTEIENELDTFRSERKQLRRGLEESLNEEPVNIEDLDETLTLVSDKVERLFTVDDQVRELIYNLPSFTEKQLEAEFDKVEEYREQWLKLRRE